MTKSKFNLTEQHLKLLRSAYVEYNDYCETGAPAIDPKRPYGNSDVASDIYTILFGEREYQQLTEKEENLCMKLHRETATALQIVLSTGKFQPGTYVSSGYDTRVWQKIS